MPQVSPPSRSNISLSVCFESFGCPEAAGIFYSLKYSKRECWYRDLGYKWTTIRGDSLFEMIKMTGLGRMHQHRIFLSYPDYWSCFKEDFVFWMRLSKNYCTGKLDVGLDLIKGESTFGQQFYLQKFLMGCASVERSSLLPSTYGRGSRQSREQREGTGYAGINLRLRTCVRWRLYDQILPFCRSCQEILPLWRRQGETHSVILAICSQICDGSRLLEAELTISAIKSRSLTSISRDTRG